MLHDAHETPRPEPSGTHTYDRRIAAIHEAAHVVAGQVLGIPTLWANIEPPETCWVMPAAIEQRSPDRPPRFVMDIDLATRGDMERVAIATLAGTEAVEFAMPSSGWGPGTARDLDGGVRHDDDRADEIAYLLAAPEQGFYRAWMASVARRICRDHADAIRRVADALLAHERVEEADLQDLVVGPNAPRKAKGDKR